MTKTDTSDIRMREAVKADVPRVAELIMHGASAQKRTPDEIAAEAQDPIYLKAFDVIAANPYNTLFVAELEGRVIGTYQITVLPGMAERGRIRAKIESVHVAPECRGRGIGAIMMRHAIAFATERGVGLVELTSHKARPEAHRFYNSLGFVQSHEGFKMALSP
ncbi:MULTISPECIES: GNAT family N-acetyltransferase [Bosea]|uniref:GNAT family N-acetyltransferase n=1 Tax=Bosea TaxID=85413 RepID=UPI00214F8321|nr:MULTISPECIES: GNAT family N-acetyltransferase [Bosea]MCR4520566.1 GNAT family N-acetyltransferase [Bosea sp. 47.2.35]MDR6827921.1 GNAT superfamily N-acetyltransferase [Bosea robiniae]MDR6894385.1 GNAT superfamily N-acetyltransferase [Bosea sp. BE109]MDR7138027.1 GNAT superfamily N-acetyltransferase [Bosea sp. BE168]MDR7174726.1 GNAT superfamily N-acetyltransferase [Bosea sp. BE271]